MSRFIRELPEELVLWPVRREMSGVADHGDLTGRPTIAPRSSRPKTPAVQPVLDDYVVGAWVEHKIFGKGQIAEREGVGDNLKLTVRFTDGKVKKLVARYANLTRL